MNEKIGITIKGIKNGILVELGQTEEWLHLTEALARQIDEKSKFYAGANVTVDLGERPVPKHDMMSLKALLDRRGLTIWSIISDSETTIDAAHALDLKTNVANTVPTRKPAQYASSAPATEDVSQGMFIKRTLRSGQRVQSPGDIVVIGDVNPGAEVIAEGNIMVWGRLRGTVHAGVEGNQETVVCALDMSPTQLRIAGYIVTSPDDPKRQPHPEIAFIRDDQIVVESWR